MSTSPSQTFAIEAIDICKSFGGVPALRGCDMRVRRGEIHALLGQNGAGKSTLVKILNGVHPQGSFEGDIHVDGAPVSFRSPAEARARGIGYVPQEIEVIERLSVAENIFAGQTGDGGRIVDWPALNRRAALLLDDLGLAFDPALPVALLSAAQRHLVMIARALAARPVVLVLDEPTASLSEPEIERLFVVLDRLRARGTAMIYITHRLPEVLAICDSASVLRDGVIAAEIERRDFNVADLIREMSGRDLGSLFPEHRATSKGSPVLSTEDLTVVVNGRTRVDRVSFELRPGEILGIAGLLGAGRTELLGALYGQHHHQGRILFDGRPHRLTRPADARALGIALLTEDRKRSGLLFNMPVAANITIGNLTMLSDGGLVRRGEERREVLASMKAFKIGAPSPDAPVVHLSGGNQQKILLARALMTRPRILLLDDPSKGVDVATRQEIYRLIVELADAGCSVIVTSSEIEEVIGLADRCLVMAEGRLVDAFARGEGDEAYVLHAIVAARRYPDGREDEYTADS